MRKPVVLLALVAVALGACGQGSTALATVRSAATKTSSATTAHAMVIIKSDSGPFAAGTTYTGGYDFGAHRGRLQFDPSTLGISGVSGNIEAVFDFSSGAVVYVHYPQLAPLLSGKTWLKVDVGALSQKTTGIDITSLLQQQSNDPASGLRLLAGATQVTKVGSEAVRGVPSTHFHAIIDVDKAAAAAPAQAQDAMRKAAALYIIKTFPMDVWLDSSQRVRRSVLIVDPANLKLPAQSAKAARQTGKLTITTELFDFGTTVDAAVPPPDQVADISQLTGGTTPASPPASGPVSAAKAAFLAKGNAICQTMNARASSLPDPGNDPVVKASVLEQGAAITADGLRQLRNLSIPVGDELTVNTIYAKVELVISDASAEAAALHSGNQAQAQAIEQRLGTDSAAANAASNAYGLTVCGS